VTESGEHAWGASAVELASGLIEDAGERGVTLRALGGVAVALRCPSARGSGPLARSFSDIDFAIRKGQQKATTAAMVDAGLAPATRFNTMHGASRLRFEREDGLHADVFVGRFELCHELPLNDRLELDEVTLPLADLLLTKLQVARLNHKDVTDSVALLLDHDVSDDEDSINGRYISELLGRDWGWWRTVTENLGTIRRLAPGLPLTGPESTLVDRRLDDLSEQIEATPRAVRWRLRARIGDRRPWRLNPEESV